MSEFAVNLHQIEVTEHPNADALELAVVGGFNSVVRKGEYRTGDIVLYFPTAAILPREILGACDLWDADKDKGMLAGSGGNRVKPIRLRGELSEGIVAKPENTILGPIGFASNLDYSHDYAEVLGIVKWIPPVPASFGGKARGNADIIPMSDIENAKSPKWGQLISDDQDVIATEKIHGSCCVVNRRNGDFTVTSKGLSKKSIVLQEEEGNIYWQAVRYHGIEQFTEMLSEGDTFNVSIFGEVFGPNVQGGFHYGLQHRQLRIFDIMIDDKYLSYDQCCALLRAFEYDWKLEYGVVAPSMTPALYRGPYDAQKLSEMVSGNETISGTEAHMREGIVVSVDPPQIARNGKRLRLKMISPEYLARKNPTEFE